MVLGGESGRDMGVSPVVPEKRLAIIIINFVEMSPVVLKALGVCLRAVRHPVALRFLA